MSTETATQVKQDRVEFIGVHNIKPSEIALRPVDKSSAEYLELVSSIRNNGVLNPILVTDLGEGVFGLVDGLHRFTAAKDAGLRTIPALIKSIEDSQLMEAQIITNLHKVETKPMEYTKQLFRLLSAQPLLTMADLADKLSVGTAWLSTRLSLINLKPEIQELVNEDKIGLANAYSLAKLPLEEQADYVDRAQTDPPTMFTPQVASRLKQIKDAAKQGKEASPATFEPIARIQARNVLQSELENPTAVKDVLASVNATTLEAAWVAALKWVLSLDPGSIEEQRKRWEDRKRQREEAAAAAKKERQARREKEAAEKAADISQL